MMVFKNTQMDLISPNKGEPWYLNINQPYDEQVKNSDAIRNAKYLKYNIAIQYDSHLVERHNPAKHIQVFISRFSLSYMWKKTKCFTVTLILQYFQHHLLPT